MQRRTVALSALAMLGLAACNRGGRSKAEADVALKANKEWLDRNGKEAGVVTRPSGLQYKVIRSGPESGAHPRPQDEVRVNYEGTLIDGHVFDSSYRGGSPVVFTLGNLIPGWVEGIGLMRPGDEWYLYVPSDLGYGDRQAGDIPPNSVLVFRIELLGVLAHAAPPAMG